MNDIHRVIHNSIMEIGRVNYNSYVKKFLHSYYTVILYGNILRNVCERFSHRDKSHRDMIK